MVLGDAGGGDGVVGGTGSTAVVQGGRHGSFGAFVAHTELAKKETTKTMEAHGGQLTKLDEAMAKSQEMLQTLMAAIGSNNKETKVLSGRVDGIEQKTDQIDEKADRIIAALEKAGVAVSPDAAAPTTAPAATPAPPSGATKPAPKPVDDGDERRWARRRQQEETGSRHGRNGE